MASQPFKDVGNVDSSPVKDGDHESDDSVIFVAEITNTSGGRQENDFPGGSGGRNQEVQFLGEFKGKDSQGPSRQSMLLELELNDDLLEVLPASPSATGKVSKKKKGHVVIDLELPSDNEKDYDSDESVVSFDSEMEAMIDRRSESDISVSNSKDYIELLEDRLERRIRRQKKVIKKKKAKSGKEQCSCACSCCHNKKRDGGGNGGGRKGGGGGGGLGAMGRAHRVLTF